MERLYSHRSNGRNEPHGLAGGNGRDVERGRLLPPLPVERRTYTVAAYAIGNATKPNGLPTHWTITGEFNLRRDYKAADTVALNPNATLSQTVLRRIPYRAGQQSGALRPGDERRRRPRLVTARPRRSRFRSRTVDATSGVLVLDARRNADEKPDRTDALRLARAEPDRQGLFCRRAMFAGREVLSRRH